MKIIILILLVLTPYFALSQQGGFKITGKVIGQNETPLVGATVKIKGTIIQAATGSTGKFSVLGNSDTTVLIISFVGYKTKEFIVDPHLKIPLSIMLEQGSEQLAEVVINTGYQELPKERSNGSFVQVDNTLLNRRVSTDILSRLEDVTSGLIFNKTGPANTLLSIRGQSTINGNAQPLIILDNFPYDGDLNNISPNDVESITVLKDAAAASIWGARSGNGVIVINTKKGRFNQPTKIAFNSNVTLSSKPNIFYQPIMSTADFIEVEKNLFAQGYYDAAQQSYNYQPLTPVVQLLYEKANGGIGGTQADQQIASLANQDVRNDYSKYFYRRAVNQQYSLNLSGGSENQRYYIAAGYDRNLDNLVNNGYDRVTLTANNTYSLFDKKLELNNSIFIVQSNTAQNNTGYSPGGSPYYPYAKLADNNGNPLNVVRDYQTGFIQSAEQLGLLNWKYSPLEELRLANNNITNSDYRINTSLKYSILPGFNAQVTYLYDHGVIFGRNLQSQDTYYTKNLINQFTQVNADGTLSRAIPLGGIMDQSNTTAIGQDFRAQLNYNKTWSTKNEITAIAGYEIRDNHTTGYQYRLYGYDDDHATNGLVSYTTQYPQYNSPGYSTVVPNADHESDLTDRYLSWYGNAAYNYDKRYTLSTSVRLDESNIFGVRSNQKGVPLYSFGLGWNVSNESFYKASWLPYLKLRVTYGANGNVYKNVSAYTTANYSGNDMYTQYPFSTIINPPNPDLKWEKVKIVNLGIDFSTKGDRISGTIEYYHKKSVDLIGTSVFAPSSGILTFTGNNAAMSGKGVDLTLNSKNLVGVLKWQTNFLFSYVTDKVTSFNYPNTGLDYIASVGTPMVGKPLYALYSFPWAGLDPQTGDPQSYLNGKVSKDYAAIYNAATPQNIVYDGPVRPTKFGSLRNTFSYKNISLSANISYRFGYFFKRNSVSYVTVLQGQGGYGDYGLRWQKPGDEAHTQVPSLPATLDSYRDGIYLNSTELIAKGDNVRLQDISLSYDLNKGQAHFLPVKHVQIYLYANNLGIIWKADKGNIDPDYSNAVYAPAKTIAIGLKVDL